MSVYIPNGSVIHLAASYGDATSMTAVSNADPGVATLESSHAIATGNIFEVTSGWSKLTDRIVRAGTVATNDVPLEGIDTTSTTFFPAGSGTGSIREILTWTQLSQILEFTGEGGEQQFLTYQFLESDAERRLPTFKSAVGVNIVVADDDTLAGYLLAKEANDDREPRAVRITKPNGGLIFFSAFITLAPMPTLEINQLARAQITFSLENPEPTKYAS
jgi:tail tube protein